MNCPLEEELSRTIRDKDLESGFVLRFATISHVDTSVDSKAVCWVTGLIQDCEIDIEKNPEKYTGKHPLREVETFGGCLQCGRQLDGVVLQFPEQKA